ncbi:MAG: tellurite resistance/C4-dicarboxylate transporter family protein [Candidatus Schekmanbacteria bacterium]|nr:tellurite resistance/C4-dicarboxylate transporter family protein [Candidatus Schekmanbacteria bacterium]
MPASTSAEYMRSRRICMGAVAISTIAGTALLSAADGSALPSSIRPFVAGLTLLYWATATWWIPMLLALGIWRHAVRRVPFTYDPLYWGLVFPLGMYSVCTYRPSNGEKDRACRLADHARENGVALHHHLCGGAGCRHGERPTPRPGGLCSCRTGARRIRHAGVVDRFSYPSPGRATDRRRRRVSGAQAHREVSSAR